MTVEGVSAAKAAAPVESRKQEARPEDKPEISRKNEEAAVVELSSREAEEAQ